MNRFPWTKRGDIHGDRLLIVCAGPHDARAAYLWCEGVGTWDERTVEVVAMGTSLDDVLAKLLEKVHAAQA